MPRPKRQLLATARETSNPPDELEEGHAIVKVVKGEGKNLYTVQLPNTKTLLVELPSRFRSTIWIKNGGYVLMDTNAFDDRENKLDGEIINVVRDEKYWRKQAYWPPEFVKKSSYLEESEEEESTAGKMPPAESDEEA